MGVSPAKIYIWLVGLEPIKGSDTWYIYNQQITTTNGYIFEYPLNKSIPDIAADLYLHKISLLEEDNEIILIGHDIGGLIARSIQLLSPNVKGIITIGTPHGGSVLFKNILQGDTYDFFTKATRMINVAIAKSLMDDSFSRSPVNVMVAPIANLVTTFKSTFATIILGEMKANYQAVFGLYGFNHPCIKDLLPNSNYIRSINENPINVPLLNIYGAEDPWQVVRAMGTYMYIAKAEHPQNNDTNYDMAFVLEMQSALGVIFQIQNMNNLIYNALTIPAIIAPWIWQSRELVLSAKYEWDFVYRYLSLGIHADFAMNMGAIGYRLQAYSIPAELSIDHSVNEQKYLPYMLDNDGFFSINDIVSPLLSGSSIQHIKMKGMNHLEMGNHVEMRKMLEDIIMFRSCGASFSQ